MWWCISYTICTHSPCNVRGMVTAKTQHNLKNAQEYFEEHLCVGDYYEEGQPVIRDIVVTELKSKQDENTLN